MKRLLVDTSAYAAFMLGRPEIVEAMTFAEELVLCPTVIGELLAGFKLGAREAKNRALLEAFLENPRVREVGQDAETSEFYATVYAALRAKGRPIPTNDLWIAATALQNGLAVCTLDAHFKQIDGLLVAPPRQDA